MGIRLDENDEILLEDFLNYKKDRPNSNNQARASPDNHYIAPTSLFWVSQQEYIDYLIHQQVRRKRKVRRYRLVMFIVGLVEFTLKATLSIILLFSVFFVFYYLVWCMQQSIY